MPRLSVCLIVKNEERVLARCLRSVQKLADEIVVVDTGSTDRTVEIARSFEAKIFEFKWKNDFAAARNFAMDQATGDWILQIDADEEFYQPDISHLRELLKRDDADGIHLVIRSFFPTPESQTDESLSEPMKHPHSVNHFPRLVRNCPGNRYAGSIHEAFPHLEHLLVSDLSIFHYGYAQEDDRKQRRLDRNRQMTLKNVEEHPEDPIAHYYAATTCLTADLSEEAEKHFLDMIRLSDPEHVRFKHFYLMALAHLATLAMLKGEHPAEERYAREATERDPNYLDPWLRLGESSFFLEKYEESEKAFQRYLEILDELSTSIRPTKYTLYLTDEIHYAYFFLGRLAQIRNDQTMAKRFYEESVSLNDKVWGPQYFLGLLYAELDDPRAESYLKRAKEINPDLVLPEVRSQQAEGRGQKSEEVSLVERLHQEAHDLVCQNRLDEAKEKLFQALKMNPDSSGICNDLGWIFFQLGQRMEAQRFWLKALRLEPQSIAVRKNLADYYFETRQMTAARNHYEAIVRRVGDKVDPIILESLADVYAEQSNFSEAEAIYKKILQANPKSPVKEKLNQVRKKVLGSTR